MEITTLLISFAALALSVFSYYAAINANRAALYDRRFEVYRDAEAFVSGWQKHGRPDMDRLPTLVDAWNRSQFLFKPEITAYLRELWVDGVKTDYCEKEASRESGAADEERKKRRAQAAELSKKHMDNERLRQAFMPQLKVSEGYLDWPRWLTRR